MVWIRGKLLICYAGEWDIGNRHYTNYSNRDIRPLNKEMQPLDAIDPAMVQCSHHMATRLPEDGRRILLFASKFKATENYILATFSQLYSSKFTKICYTKQMIMIYAIKVNVHYVLTSVNI